MAHFEPEWVAHFHRNIQYGKNTPTKNVLIDSTRHFEAILEYGEVIGYKQPFEGLMPGDYVRNFNEEGQLIMKVEHRYSCPLSDSCRKNIIHYEYEAERLFGKRRLSRSSSGEHTYLVKYTYPNDSVRIAKSNGYNYSDNSILTKTAQYEKLDIKNTFYNTIKETRTLFFDELGRPKEYQSSVKGELRNKEVYFYDKESQTKPAWYKSYYKGKHNTNKYFQYDEKGNLINSRLTDVADNSLLYRIFEYDYDSYGNWFELRMFNADKTRLNVIKRKITYLED